MPIPFTPYCSHLLLLIFPLTLNSISNFISETNVSNFLSLPDLSCNKALWGSQDGKMEFITLLIDYKFHLQNAEQSLLKGMSFSALQLPLSHAGKEAKKKSWLMTRAWPLSECTFSTTQSTSLPVQGDQAWENCQLRFETSSRSCNLGEMKIPFWVQEKLSKLEHFRTEKTLQKDRAGVFRPHDIPLQTVTPLVPLFPKSWPAREGISLLLQKTRSLV